MRFECGVTFNYDERLDEELRLHGVPVETLGLPDQRPVTLALQMFEDDPRWPLVQTMLNRYPGRLNWKYPQFTKQELGAARWLELGVPSHHGYPQPEDGYEAVVYDTSRLCRRCCSGKVQVAPFRMKGEPKWGTRHVLQLNWAFDAFFTRPDTWVILFKPMGIDCWPVIHHRKKHELETVVQLKAQGMVPGPLRLPANDGSTCDQCGRFKYRPIKGDVGFFPTFEEPPTSGHLLMSQEEFGDGQASSRAVFASGELYRAVVSAKVKGLEFRPVVEY